MNGAGTRLGDSVDTPLLRMSAQHTRGHQMTPAWPLLDLESGESAQKMTKLAQARAEYHNRFHAAYGRQRTRAPAPRRTPVVRPPFCIPQAITSLGTLLFESDVRIVQLGSFALHLAVPYQRRS